MEHPLTEAGGHTLICTVSYYDDMVQEEKSFRKVFKFQVNQPLSIKSVKIYTVKVLLSYAVLIFQFFFLSQDHVFVALELQNLMPNPLFLDSVALEPNPAFTLLDHSIHSDDAASEMPMSIEEVRRFLFELIPRVPTGILHI